MKRLLRPILIVSALVLIVGGGYWSYQHFFAPKIPVEDSFALVTVGGMQFEIADTQAKQEIGLSNRPTIPDNYGMLFVFAKPQKYGFWMKDMLTSIDIVWLDASGSVILINHDVSPSTYPSVFYPPSPVKYVLETRAGYAREKGWSVGTIIPLPAPSAP